MNAIEIALQLHELRLAEGSPVGGAKEYQHQAFWPHYRLQGLHAAVLVRRGEFGNRLSRGGSATDGLGRREGHKEAQEPCDTANSHLELSVARRPRVSFHFS